MLGIDVSKDDLAAALRDPLTRTLLWEMRVPNTKDGIETLLSRAPTNAPWVLEPTGRYGLLAVKEARRAGRDVRLAPTRQAKAFLTSVQSRAKTDTIDGRGLSLFALSRPLPAYPLKEAAVDAVDQLLSARRGLSRCLTRLRLQQKSLPEAASHLDGAIDDLSARLAELDKAIAAATSTAPALSPTVSALRAVPGIGPVSAAALSARLVAKSFAHPDAFVAYCGLDVAVSQSGKRAGQRGLTHQGDAELRRLLYVCAQANLRCKDSPFKDQYQRERAKGLSTTASLCAVARKLARLCWSLHKHGTAYDPARVATQGGSRAPVAAKVPSLAGETGASAPPST